MSFLNQLSELKAEKAKLAATEAQFLRDRDTALAQLPAQFGYQDLKSFIKALTAAAKIRPRKKAAKPAAKKRTRVKITPELKQAAITALQANEPAAGIAQQLGISLGSVQNIKKDAGLVKARA